MIHSSLPARRRQRLIILVATVVSLIATSMPNVIALGARIGATTAPNTTITSSPANPSSSTSASFAFSSTKGGSSFTCKLDSDVAGLCTSPKTYSGLAAGSHTFSVYATWKGTADPSPATRAWTVDLTLPTDPTNLAATTPTATSVALTWSASTDNIGIGGYDIWRDGASLMSVGTTTTYTDSTVLAGSTHTYQVRARDTAGNVSGFSTSVPVTLPTPPDTFIDSGPPAGTTDTSASLTFSSDLAGSTFTCKLDGAAAVACASPVNYTGLTEAVHTFSVYATLNGIADPNPATATWTVDLTAPSAPTGLAASQLSPTSVQLTWTAATDNFGVTGYDVFRDAVRLATIGAVTAYTDATVPSGTTPAYTMQAFDIAGNQSPMTAPVTAPPPSAPLNPALTRMTYLTDLVGLSATVNFATDRSGTVASVAFGPASGSSCSPTTVVPATKITVSVNNVFEYQWKAPLTLPAAGSYCYRAFLGTVDLLGANPAPVFQTQVPIGSTEAFSFAVFGDWGQTDTTGANPYQAGVMSQIAASGARFAITTGDQGYPSGAQNDYGDLQSQRAGIFGMPFWGGVGSELAIFPILGNHGFARNDAIHPHFANWPEDTAVTTSGGRAQMTSYGSINGSSPATYPDSWYAFSAGNARFYMLTATWSDANVGTGSVYGNDYLAHWTATSPEYQWLQADLAAHPSGLKFAFFHYPLYSDQPAENSDTYLQGNSSLEGLLASNGVNIAFNGHAHIYERNAAATGAGRLGLVSYVTGGGGGQAQSTSTCSSIDRYAVGWSYTNNRGTACGTAIAPTSPAQVHHFLKVTINGSTVTVTPTDSTGRTFDVQTYTFSPTAPGAPTNVAAVAGNASASLTWTAPASDGGSPITGYTATAAPGGATCTSAALGCTVSGLTNGTSYTFTVTATNAIGTGPASLASNAVTPATVPGAPLNVTALAGNTTATVSWSAPASNGGSPITAYTVTGTPGGSAIVAGSSTSATVNGLTNGTTYTFTVTATNAIGPGPVSAPSNSVTPTGVIGPPTFAPIADAYVSSVAKTSNFGTATTLQVGSGLHSYLMFDVEGLAGSFTTATLRLWTVTAGSGATVHDTSAAWTETGITWATAPAYGSLASTVSNFAAGTWISYNVTSFVLGNGVVAFEYTSASTTPISFASREDAAHAPQLVITP